MTRLLAVFAFLVLLAGVRADDFESRLLEKFDRNAKGDVEKLRQFVDASVTQAKAIKETDPDTALELLRQASIRIDRLSLLPYADRKALSDGIRPILQEMRDEVLLRKRVEATKKLSQFRDFLEVVAFELRNPGRSGPDHWEPAYAIDPGGRPQLVQLLAVNGDGVVFKAGNEEKKSVSPKYFPWIQVGGGVYVYDVAVNHHMWMSNQQFFNLIFMPLVDAYVAEDPRNRGVGARSRSTSDPLLQRQIDNGVFFLRGLVAIEPIPGLVENQETDFLEWAGQRVLKKALPTPISRIYDHEMLDRLDSLRMIQVSAVNRALQMLRQKGVASSKLYAEILREETTSLLRSEYPTWDDSTTNRALIYLFNKLRE
jgi:hypothetical protein